MVLSREVFYLPNCVMVSVKGYCCRNVNLVVLVFEENLHSSYNLFKITELQRCYSHLEKARGGVLADNLMVANNSLKLGEYSSICKGTGD